jgi:hypothetical protein
MVVQLEQKDPAEFERIVSDYNEQFFDLFTNS